MFPSLSIKYTLQRMIYMYVTFHIYLNDTWNDYDRWFIMFATCYGPWIMINITLLHTISSAHYSTEEEWGILIMSALSR